MRLQKIEQVRRGEPVSDIRRTLSYRPELFGRPFSAYLQAALRGPSDWSIGERELFAAFVSHTNRCTYSTGAHGAVASKVLSDDLVQAVLDDWRTAPIDEKVRVTLGLLEKVTLTPAEVGPEDVAPLRVAGVNEQAIEDALVVCALFNIIDRIADALAVTIPSAEGFAQTAARLLEQGYL